MQFRDTGAGTFHTLGGEIDYIEGTLTLPTILASTLTAATWSISGPDAVPTYNTWSRNSAVTLTWAPDSVVSVAYAYGPALANAVESFSLDSLVWDFAPGSYEAALPGSLRFTDGAGRVLIERAGGLYADIDPVSGSGTYCGSFDRAARRASLTVWTTGADNTATLQSLATRLGVDAIAEITFRTPAAPVRAQSLQVRATQLDGTTITAEADANGAISTAAMRGEIVHDTGVVHIRFGEYVTAAGNEAEWWYREDLVSGGQIWRPLPVFAESVLYNCTMIRRDALPADVVGVEITRLPPDGRVPIFRPTGLVYVHHTDSLTVTTPAAGGAADCGRTSLERVWVKDANGAKVPGAQYTATDAELDAGVIHWADPLDNTGHPYPWTVYHRISAGGTARLVDTFGRVVLSRPLSRDFPADETYVSSALYIGDIQAAWSIPFFQKVWANTWADSLEGEESLAQYDYLNYPLQVTLRGVTYKTRVALIVTLAANGANPPKFRCVLEDIGQIASNIPMDEDFAPINPATGVPIFTILADGWGDWSGWAVSNAVRFNLEPGNFPVEFARCLQPSEAAGGDSFEFEVHGNIDA